MTGENVRIVVDAARAPGGRLTGSVTSSEGDTSTFSGTLELLARIESAIDAESPHHPPTT